jgi:hypothetical protein
VALQAGEQIGPYQIKALIGAGGMGEVYRAHDDRLSRDVALKLMTEDASGDATRLRRMQQEARAVARLSHPNVLGVFDVGSHDGRMFLVTELLEGEPLARVIERGPTPWRSALRIAAQIAEGLSAAHEQGIIHRDIKPDNVFVLRDGRVKILDFGVATWRTGGAEALASATAETLSQAGLLVGTVGYMSPEQARGQSVDHRSDVFAFGCVLHELLSGKRAFDGDNPLTILVAIQRDAPAALPDLVPNLPADLVRLVERCLEKDPAARFQSMRDLSFALSVLATTSSLERVATAPAQTTPSGDGAAASPARPAQRRVGRAAQAVLLALGLAGAAMAGRASVRVPEPPRFQQITYRRGTVYTARFTPDGSAVAFAAAWDGKPRELFLTVPGSHDPRSLAIPDTDIAAFVGTGEMHVLRRSAGGFSTAVLARASLAGGPTKDLVDGVTWADTTDGGEHVAVVRHADVGAQLEYPVGKVLTRRGSITSPRLSPDGSHVAFVDGSEGKDDTGKLVVVDREGRVTTETKRWNSIEGVAWRGDREVWFTASDEGRSLAIHAVDLKGRQRLVCRAAGRLVLHDVSADGRAVAERNSYRASVVAGTGGAEIDLSWQDFSQLGALSRDGASMLFSEIGDGAGAAEVTYLRPLDGGPPLRLGVGLGLALSADARRAVLRVEEGGAHLEIVPVGAGGTQRLPAGPLKGFAWAAFHPDGQRLVFVGHEANRPDRVYLQSLSGGDPQPLGTEGVRIDGDAVSPDGRTVAARVGRRVLLVPLDGSAPRELAGFRNATPVGWSADGKQLFTRSGQPPVHLERYDLATATFTALRTVEPHDKAGLISAARVLVAREGEVYAYESYRLLSDLYVIDNLR